MERKTINIPAKQFEEKVVRQYRNYKLILFICLAAIGLLFLVLSFSYFTHQRLFPNKPLNIHPIFMVNTAVLIFSSIVLEFGKLYFKRDQWKSFKYSHLLFLVLGIAFMAGQIAGWFILAETGFGLQHNSAAYLFLISGFHGLHLAGGLIFYGYFAGSSWKFLQDYATAIVYFTDPVAKLQLSLFSLYWHFLGFVWIYLLLFFVIVR
jgi:cytochrome c oxidase subunit III